MNVFETDLGPWFSPSLICCKWVRWGEKKIRQRVCHKACLSLANRVREVQLNGPPFTRTLNGSLIGLGSTAGMWQSDAPDFCALVPHFLTWNIPLICQWAKEVKQVASRDVFLLTCAAVVNTHFITLHLMTRLSRHSERHRDRQDKVKCSHEAMCLQLWIRLPANQREDMKMCETFL